jgi:lipopolysaccharide/colanic/teichoic acid biosynthesis glycosyltransferase
MDLDYQAQWSLEHDVRLILETIGAVVFSKGAC